MKLKEMVAFCLAATVMAAPTLGAMSMYLDADASAQAGYASRDPLTELRSPVMLEGGFGFMFDGAVYEGRTFSLAVRAGGGASVEIHSFDPFVRRRTETVRRIGGELRWDLGRVWTIRAEAGWQRMQGLVYGRKAGGADQIYLTLTPSIALAGLEDSAVVYHLTFPVTGSWGGAAWDVSAGVGLGFSIDGWSRYRGLMTAPGNNDTYVMRSREKGHD